MAKYPPYTSMIDPRQMAAIHTSSQVWAKDITINPGSEIERVTLEVNKEQKRHMDKATYQRFLQNLILPEYEPDTMPEIVCEMTKIGPIEVVIVVARNNNGVMHTFAEDVRDFPSPALLTKLRLFK